MKTLNLSNPQEYFYRADIPFYKIIKYRGNICKAVGLASNTLTDETCEFKLHLREDDMIILNIDNEDHIIP